MFDSQRFYWWQTYVRFCLGFMEAPHGYLPIQLNCSNKNDETYDRNNISDSLGHKDPGQFMSLKWYLNHLTYYCISTQPEYLTKIIFSFIELYSCSFSVRNGYILLKSMPWQQIDGLKSDLYIIWLNTYLQNLDLLQEGSLNFKR